MALAMAPLPLHAKSPVEITARYDFFVGGFRIAEVVMTATSNDAGYAAASNAVTRGVLEVLLRGRSSSQATGARGVFGQFVPNGFSARYSTRTGEQAVRIGYERASPSTVVFEPQAEDSEKHAGVEHRIGTLDPLSAAVAALIPALKADLCNRTIPVFDGKRRFDIIFLPPDPARFSANVPPEWPKPLTRCLGLYERIAGFDVESLEDERFFPFDIWFEDSGDGVFRAVRMAGKTKLGYAIGNLRVEK